MGIKPSRQLRIRQSREHIEEIEPFSSNLSVAAEPADLRLRGALNGEAKTAERSHWEGIDRMRCKDSFNRSGQRSVKDIFRIR